MITFYKEFGPWGFLASYSNHGFFVDGIWWPTTEHYYQAQKFDDPKIQEMIRSAKTPKMASEIGRDRNLPLKQNWDKLRCDVMYFAVLKKFQFNNDICFKLLATGDEEIVEKTTKEFFWG